MTRRISFVGVQSFFIGLLLLTAAGDALADHGSDRGPSAQPPPPLVRVRSASRSLPMLAAIANGFFTAEHINVDYTQFGSSRPTFIQVSNHEVEVIISATDNAVNYQVNPDNPAGGILDVQIIFAHDNGLGLAIACLPEFKTVESVRGKRVGVDVPFSGFSLPVQRIFRDHGLEAGTDYTLLSAGSSPARFQGLLASPPQWECAIINAESVVRARELGLSIIEEVSNVIHPYVGGIGASSRFWLRNNPQTAARFVRGFVRGTNWVFNPRNRAAVINLLLDAETTPELAAKIYDLNVSDDGLARGAALSIPAFKNVLQVRADFDGFQQKQTVNFLASPFSGLYDLSFYVKALIGLPFSELGDLGLGLGLGLGDLGDDHE